MTVIFGNLLHVQWWCARCEVGGVDASPRCWCCGASDVTRGSVLILTAVTGEKKPPGSGPP